jgi:hypothetical protein
MSNNNNNNNNKKGQYSIKPPTFNVDLWDMITNGYTPHVDANSVKFERSAMSDQQKKDSTNHYKARTTLLNSISYNEYEKITKRDSAKAIFDH